MNQKKLFKKVMSLVLEINEETEYQASFSMFSYYIEVKVQDKKQFIAPEIYSMSQIYSGRNYSPRPLKINVKEFFKLGLKLIEEQNPATYKRIKDQY